ncbi:hypothetical protein AB0H00_22635 [Nocardia sp. NPDC023852]|uniref:hypothetical protein n=1 Tax=Nocardia sp. NPDC023852 TaxID=3154697 RepID=UPI0034033125
MSKPSIAITRIVNSGVLLKLDGHAVLGTDADVARQRVRIRNRRRSTVRQR